MPKKLIYIIFILILNDNIIAAEHQENPHVLGKRLLDKLMHSEDLDRHGGCLTQEMADEEVKANAMKLLNAHPHPEVDVNVIDLHYGWTPLLVALDRNFFEIANILLDRGANIDERTRRRNFTPLMYACMWNNFDFASRLISLGADVNAVDDREDVVLMHVNNFETAKLLIQNGANIHHTNLRGRTALSHFENEEERLELEKIVKERSLPLTKKDK